MVLLRCFCSAGLKRPALFITSCIEKQVGGVSKYLAIYTAKLFFIFQTHDKTTQAWGFYQTGDLII